MLPSPAPDTCWLYLLRHGATTHNTARPKRLQGSAVDLGLSPEGLRQAEETACFLEGAQLSAIYCSRLKRAAETARIVGRAHSLEPRVCPELQEVDVGRWENLNWNEIEAAEPEAFRLFHEDAGRHGFAGGENLAQVLERVRGAFDEILATNLGRSVAVVGHNVVNRAWLAHVLGMPLSKAFRILQDNCCVNVIRYQAGEAVVATLNSTFHLR